MPSAVLASATSRHIPGLPIRRKKLGIICQLLVSFVIGRSRATRTQEEHTVYFSRYFVSFNQNIYLNFFLEYVEKKSLMGCMKICLGFETHLVLIFPIGFKYPEGA